MSMPREVADVIIEAVNATAAGLTWSGIGATARDGGGVPTMVRHGRVCSLLQGNRKCRSVLSRAIDEDRGSRTVGTAARSQHARLLPTIECIPFPPTMPGADPLGRTSWCGAIGRKSNGRFLVLGGKGCMPEMDANLPPAPVASCVRLSTAENPATGACSAPSARLTVASPLDRLPALRRQCGNPEPAAHFSCNPTVPSHRGQNVNQIAIFLDLS